MQRRTFLTRTSQALAVSVTNLSITLSLTGCGSPNPPSTSSDIPEGLADQLIGLEDTHFADAVKNQSDLEIFDNLVDNGVVTEPGHYSQPKLEPLAESEELVIYKGFYYTKAELDVYALAWLLNG